MANLFFINDEHRENFDLMQRAFPVSYSDLEYKSACYISALPMIFYKFSHEIYDYDVPIDWMINWQKKHLPQEHDESNEMFAERTQIEVNYDLTHSMQELGKLALNLFNRYEYFNLMDCLNSLDDVNVDVLKVAIDVRLGKCKEQ